MGRGQIHWNTEEEVHSAKKGGPQVPWSRSALSITSVAHVILRSHRRKVGQIVNTSVLEISVPWLLEGSGLITEMGAQSLHSQGRLLPSTPVATLSTHLPCHWPSPASSAWVRNFP